MQTMHAMQSLHVFCALPLQIALFLFIPYSLYLFTENKYSTSVYLCMYVCTCVHKYYLCISREAGTDYPRQQLAVYGRGWDDLSRGHGGDALQSFLLGILVLHVNKHHTLINIVIPLNIVITVQLVQISSES